MKDKTFIFNTATKYTCLFHEYIAAIAEMAREEVLLAITTETRNWVLFTVGQVFIYFVEYLLLTLHKTIVYTDIEDLCLI